MGESLTTAHARPSQRLGHDDGFDTMSASAWQTSADLGRPRQTSAWQSASAWQAKRKQVNPPSAEDEQALRSTARRPHSEVEVELCCHVWEYKGGCPECRLPAGHGGAHQVSSLNEGRRRTRVGGEQGPCAPEATDSSDAVTACDAPGWGGSAVDAVAGEHGRVSSLPYVEESSMPEGHASVEASTLSVSSPQLGWTSFTSNGCTSEAEASAVDWTSSRGQPTAAALETVSSSGTFFVSTKAAELKPVHDSEAVSLSACNGCQQPPCSAEAASCSEFE